MNNKGNEVNVVAIYILFVIRSLTTNERESNSRICYITQFTLSRSSYLFSDVLDEPVERCDRLNSLRNQLTSFYKLHSLVHVYCDTKL